MGGWEQGDRGGLLALRRCGAGKNAAAGTAGPQGAGQEEGPSGLSRWIDEPGGGTAGPSWRTILTHWRLIEADLQDFYGIDVDDKTLMRARSWRWLRLRVAALLEVPPDFIVYGEGGRIATSPRTRLGFALNPPRFSD